ncbi:hypothetical protein [Deinococcus sp.]|uniref:hypothetical protein n=1 Tax=Deinococcus sp. TaxID=47478 RepID=UPI0025E84809|nr:hypothetical protein [Deinococcus sp.]
MSTKGKRLEALEHRQAARWQAWASSLTDAEFDAYMSGPRAPLPLEDWAKLKAMTPDELRAVMAGGGL